MAVRDTWETRCEAASRRRRRDADQRRRREHERPGDEHDQHDGHDGHDTSTGDASDDGDDSFPETSVWSLITSSGFDTVDPPDCAPLTRVTFAWGLQAGTAFDDCAAPGGDAGFAVPQGGTVQIKPTFHGDHWFFTNVTAGAEQTMRRAQWIADAQADRDEQTSLDELRATPAAALFTPDLGYNLSGALIPIVTAYDYLEAQARSIGDFQGEDECPTRTILP